MYTKTVEFRFNDEVAPSRRLEFLARLARACEQETVSLPNHHYFTISMNRNGQCRIDFMMPSVFEVGKEKLRTAQLDGLLTVTHPILFSTDNDAHGG